MPPYQHKQRSYLHFDPAPDAAFAESYATDPAQVAHHSFYPFLGFTINTPKVKKGPNGEFIRKNKKRPIKLAAHLDAAIYAHYARILSERYEIEVAARGLGDCVLAFRRAGGPGRNNISFAREVFDFIESHRPCTAIGFDVEKFFDRLSHAVLKQQWQATLGAARLPQDHFNLFKNLTDFAWVDRDRAYGACGISPHNPRPRNLYRNRICTPADFRSLIRGGGLICGNPERSRHRGIPQGAPISALLSNIYMLEFDALMQATVSAHGGLYRRYCDDIAVVVPTSVRACVELVAMAHIGRLHLRINPGKTTCAEFPAQAGSAALGGDKTQFLGFDFDGARRLIRGSSLTRYYGKMRRGVSLTRQTWLKHNRLEAERNAPLSGMKTRQLYLRYSYLIKRRFREKSDGHERQGENFITYAYRAADEMQAPEIKRQVRGHLAKLRAAIRKARS